MTVEVGMTVPHARVQYASVREALAMTVDLEDGERASDAMRRLRWRLEKALDESIKQRSER